VLFYARIFERGHDRSFAELSRFVRADAARGGTNPASSYPPSACQATRRS
jgi:hypothetical protein